MAIFNQKKSRSYYEGELVMFDGVKDGENVYTFLSKVVLVRTNNNLCINAKTKEKYKINEKEIEVGDIICRINRPLFLKNENEVDRYILKSSFFYKDRISIYDEFPLSCKNDLVLAKKIESDKNNFEIYNQIVNEQSSIVKAYAKTKNNR